MSLPAPKGQATLSPVTATEAAEAQAQLLEADAATVLEWAERRLGAQAAIASSFGVEDVVLIDLASRHAPSLRVFTLDTGRLHPETYEVMEAVRNRYGLTLETYFPDARAVEELTRTRGHFSFRESVEARKQCCGLRKLEPLSRALSGRAGWVTGLRREQSPTRAQVQKVELDPANGGLAKVNPLADWTEAEVWAYVAVRGLVYNPLHDQGFRSIGCAPCTRALKPYEDVRAGRWWWENPEHKECGLHPRR